MLTSPEADFRSPGLNACAVDVARGVTRMMLRHDLVAICEVTLDNGRRADVMAVDARGGIVIVEIKVSRADLLGDTKWPDYLGHCDRFFWAVPAGFDTAPLDREMFMPQRTGVIVADRYDATILREAHSVPMAAARRRRCTLGFARRAGMRSILMADPEAAAGL